MADILGTGSDDQLMGTAGADRIDGAGGVDMLHGYGGDDIIFAGRLGGMVSGGAGNDIIYAYGYGGPTPHRYQTHVMGNEGDDTIRMFVSNFSTDSSSYRFGHHVFGNDGADRFEFVGIAASDQRILGRIDDFDYSRDSIWLDGVRLNLLAPPDNVRIVEYRGQQWLLIDERILYGLEGARHHSMTVPADGKNADEMQEDHFVDWPEEWAAGVPQSATVSYANPVNFVPQQYFADAPAYLNRIVVSDVSASGTLGADSILGGQNVNNEINGQDGHDYIWSNRGDDTVRGGGGDDTVDGFLGNDVLYGGNGNDIIDGNKSHDLIYGGAGRDIISGGSDDDTVYGGDDADVIFGGSEQDRLIGGGGDDMLLGCTGDDTLIGSTGDDSLRGGLGNDILSGEGGGDELFGQNGNDYLHGGDGADSLIGGSGRDTLVGGQGADTMSGGPDTDCFVFRSAGEAVTGDTVNVVLDFQRGAEKIVMTLVDADVSLAGNQVLNFSGNSAAANSVWWVRDQGDVMLRADVDGDAQQDFEVHLLGVSALGSSDLVL